MILQHSIESLPQLKASCTAAEKLVIELEDRLVKCIQQDQINLLQTQLKVAEIRLTYSRNELQKCVQYTNKLKNRMKSLQWRKSQVDKQVQHEFDKHNKKASKSKYNNKLITTMQVQQEIGKQLKPLQRMFSKYGSDKLQEQLVEEAYNEHVEFLPETAVPTKEEEVPEEERAHRGAIGFRPYALRKRCPSPKFSCKNRRGRRSWRVSGGARRSRKPALTPQDIAMKQAKIQAKAQARAESESKGMMFAHYCATGGLGVEEIEGEILVDMARCAEEYHPQYPLVGIDIKAVDEDGGVHDLSCVDSIRANTINDLAYIPSDATRIIIERHDNFDSVAAAETFLDYFPDLAEVFAETFPDTLRAGGKKCGSKLKSNSTASTAWQRSSQEYQARFRRSLTAGSIQQQSFPFSQEGSNACASIAMYTAIQYALTPSHLYVQAEDFRRSTTSIGRDIAVETRFIHEERVGSFIKRDQFEDIFRGFIDNGDRIVCQEYNGHDIYSSSVGLIELLLDGSTQDSKNVAITLNCNGHVFFLANRSDGAFDLIDSLPAEELGFSSAFRLTCKSHADLNTALLCLLSSRSTGSPASKWFDAVVYYGQSDTDIDGLETSVNTFIEESRSARGARGARVIEAPSAKPEVKVKRSRLDVAAEIGTSSFDEEQSSSIVSASINSNNPTLEELNDALDHVDKCIKNCDSEDVQKKFELERQKVLLLIKFIPLHIEKRPSDEKPSGSSRRSGRSKKKLSKAARSKEKEVEKKRKEIRQTWSSTLVNAVSLLGRGVAILERSQLYKEEIDSFKQHHQTLLVDCIDATQPPKPTSKSTFTIVKFMEDNFVHINLLKAATKFMTDKESSHGVVRVLQEKLHFLDKALKTNMPPEAFLNEWNRLEEADAEAVRQVICKEGLYVTVEDKKTGETKRICVVEPGSYWEQNVLTGVQLYRLAVALKNWHPPIKEKKKEGMAKKEDDDAEMEEIDNKSEKKEAAKPDLKNGCLRGVNELGPRIVHIEGGGEMTDELRRQVIDAIAIFDLHDLFPKTKKYWDMEFTEFARLSGLGSFINFQLRGMVRLQAQLVLNKLCGQRSHMATFSAEAAKAGFTIPYGAGVSADVTNAGRLPHGEAQCEPKIKMASNTYSYQDLLNHSASLGALFSPIVGMNISFMSIAMAIIARRHNDHHLSEEDEELLRKMKRQWCVDGYNAAIEAVSIKYSEEFSKYCEDILDVDVTSENVDPKEIYECQKSFFGSFFRGAMGSVAAAFVRVFEKLDNDVKASNNAFSSEITSLIIPHLKKRERAKYDNLLKHFKLNELLSKMKSCHGGTEKGGAIGEVAAAFSRVFDEELPGEVQASNDAFSSEITSLILPRLQVSERSKYEMLSKQYDTQEDLLSKMKSSHDGIKKTGSLATVAAAFVRVFEKKLSGNIKASYTAYSPEITKHIISLFNKDEKEQYYDLLEQYDNNKENLLSKMEGRRGGNEKGGTVSSLAAAFSRAFKELDDDIQASNNAFSSKITSLILPHLQASERSAYNNLIKSYDKPEDLLSKMKKCHDGQSNSYAKGMKQVKTNASGRKRKARDGKGSGGQNEDPRMKAAVKAKLATPSLNHYQALVAGGFDFQFQNPELKLKANGEPAGAVTDKDGKTYKYRRKKLSERLKHTTARKAAEKEGRSYTERGGIQDVKDAKQPTTSATMSGVVTAKSTASSKTTKSGDKRKAGDFSKVDKKGEKKKKKPRRR